MATAELPADTRPRARTTTVATPTAVSAVRPLLAALASLKLTVVLLSLSIFLVLAGTLAQRFYDVWEPVNHVFRSLVAWIELRWFLPRTLAEPSASVGFPFFGGWLLGGALTANLLAAHAIRFKVSARGRRLVAGLLVLIAGVAATWAVIQSGLQDTLLSQLSPRLANGLWHGLRALIGGAGLALGWVVAITWPQVRGTNAKWLWGLGAVTATLLLALTVTLFANPDWRLDASGLRILWQLFKGLGAAAVLLAGCWLLFAKRAGVVLLHAGVALLMASELHTGLTAVESQMQIVEGDTAAYSEDMRSVELAVVDKSDPQVDQVVRVPGALIAAAADAEGDAAVIDDPQLPVKLRVERYLPNSIVRWRTSGDASPADAGLGQLRTVDAAKSSVGVDTEQTHDTPAAYVKLLAKDDGQSLGTFLLHPHFYPQVVETPGGQPYEVALRYRRLEKPYRVQLLKLTAEQYVGTDTAKHYESLVRLTDPAHNVDRTISIWMNNPLRYAGDTLYQSNATVIPGGRSVTGLQVMTNSGWLVPYLACVIVGVGMFAHFALAIARFVRRRNEEAARAEAAADEDAAVSPFWIDRSLTRDWKLPVVWVPALIVLVFASWIASRARPPREDATKFHLSQAAALPVAANGRVQPLDTLARNTLAAISGKETYDDGSTPKETERLPAIQWLLEVASDKRGWQKHPVFRIENLDVLQALSLEPRSGFRYSLMELLEGENAEVFDEQVRLARQELATVGEVDKLQLGQRKFLEAYDKLQRVIMLTEVFGVTELSGSTQQEAIASLQAAKERIVRLNDRQPPAPLPLPPAEVDGRWQTPLEADFAEVMRKVARQSDGAHPGLPLLTDVLDAYAAGDVAKFNAALDDYRQWIDGQAAAEAEHEAELAAAGERGTRKFVERLAPERIAWEVTYNRLNLFAVCKALYIVAFLLACAAWLGWTEGFNRSANWLLWLTFTLHTAAIVARIYISGRPPVTNLYSSAVFIGWGAVLFALVFEIVYRNGIGNLLAAAIGFPSLVVASNLAVGDTFTVMQAVLDTQFWLATHVVCISLGYTTTFVAGFLGIIWLVLGWLTHVLSDRDQKNVTRMIYGTLCFAIFFSFVGTVLGGLWADDSWGRFWGWDPKENGALMIVLWNAVVLHARWGKLVGPRGLAVLAVFGNVVTAWSWFGVNQLGVGLHSYGFTSGITIALIGFAASQLALMAAAALPQRRPSPAAV